MMFRKQKLEETFGCTEVGRYLNKSVANVIKMIRSGELAGFDVSNKPSVKPRFRVTASALENYVRKRSVTPNDATPAAPKRFSANDDTTQEFV